jgi:hypothetical protein
MLAFRSGDNPNPNPVPIIYPNKSAWISFGILVLGGTGGLGDHLYCSESEYGMIIDRGRRKPTWESSQPVSRFQHPIAHQSHQLHCPKYHSRQKI